MLTDELKRGGRGTETYTVTDGETGEVLYFNISAMREWARVNLPVTPTPPNFDVAARLINDQTVDPSHIAEHTLHVIPEPIIICRQVFGGDQVVDGSHRFVAFCTGCAMWQLNEAYFPAFVLQPHEWAPFVIPDSVVRACGFHRSYEAWVEGKNSI